MSDKSTHTDLISSAKHCDGHPIAGHLETSLSQTREYREDCTCALPAKEQSPTKTSISTTNSLSSAQAEGSCPGESISYDSYVAREVGKSSAKDATLPKPNERIQEGGRKDDSEKPPMELLSSIALVEIAKVMGKGRDKYGAHNWRKGIIWSRVFGAALRHIFAWVGGTTEDSETGLNHLAHAACCIMFLLDYTISHPELDDRYSSLQKKDTK